MPLALIGQSIIAATVATTLSAAPTPARSLVVPTPARSLVVPRAQSLATGHRIYGFIQSLSGSRMVITNRKGAAIVVDVHAALSSVRPFRGRPVIVFGTVEANGVIEATAVWRSFPNTARWPVDR